MDFKLHSEYGPAGDQPKAIGELIGGIENGKRFQTLLGVTGSGKTFTMANVIQKVGRPTLIISHNKTLAGQLYAEMKEYFPENAVEFFVSYYDYYQPEAYIAESDTYIEKDSDINEDIDAMRHSATKSLLTRDDVIVIASVSCIYGIGEKDDYRTLTVDLKAGQEISPEEVMEQLVNIRYERNDYELLRGTFRKRGDILDVLTPDTDDVVTRISFFGDEIEKISLVDKITGKTIVNRAFIEIFPASHYAISKEKLKKATETIEAELDERIEELRNEGKVMEAYRLEQRTRYDLELMRETGSCKGIENYSRHMSQRKAGEPPCTLMDFFPDDYLLIIDESHVTVPQVGAMYNGDRSRKDMLVKYGFRLPSAYDNRPLKFEEFEQRMGTTIFVSATPGRYEIEHSDSVIEQVIRPTGLLDPLIAIRPVEGQIEDILHELSENTAAGGKSLIMTLTKKMAEDLTSFLAAEGVRVKYLHSDIKTVERMTTLNLLRSDEIDVIVGINLLREGIDLPEVSLLMILDADKEGFLRSERSLIQIIGRCARNSNGRVILYADEITDSIMNAVSETNRRREIQMRYNEEHGIVPVTIKKDIRNVFDILQEASSGTKTSAARLLDEDKIKASKEDREKIVNDLKREMQKAAKELDFEKAAELRDIIIRINGKI